MSSPTAVLLGAVLAASPIVACLVVGVTAVFRDFGRDALPGCVLAIVGGLAVGFGILLLAWGLTS